MRNKILFILCISLFSFELSAQIIIGGDSFKLDYVKPREYTLGGLTVSGVDDDKKNTLKLISGLYEREKLYVPGEKFSKAIDNLWKQGLFDDIMITVTKVQGDDIFLNVHVVEKPRLSRFSFSKGIGKNEADDLRKKIGLVRGQVLTDYRVAAAVGVISEHYVDKGYYNVKVSTRKERDTAEEKVADILYFEIVKGSKVKVEDISFAGNTAFSDRKMRRLLKETKRKRWWNVFNSGKYLEENFDKDKEKLIAKYNQKGFRDAKIARDSVYRVSDNRVKIDLVVDEGHRYYFRNITWLGNSKYESKILSSVLGIKKGDVFDQTALDSKLFMNANGNDVSSLYMDDGYLFFQLNPVEVLVENDSIDLEMRIYEGKQATINKVTVTGNTKTNDHVIMREIRTRPGQLFRRSDIIRSQRELAQLGFFNPEKMGVNPTPNPANGTVDIEYVVEEKPSDQVELSGGWGAGRVVGTLGVVFNNFSAKNMFKGEAWRPLPAGDGQKLSVRAQSNGLFYQSYNASFTEPWLGGKKPNSLSVSLYKSVQSNGQKRKIDTDSGKFANPLRHSLAITGLSVGFGKRLKWPDDYFSIYTEATMAHYVINKYGSIFTFSDGVANNFSLKGVISRNSIDKPIFETRGSNISLSVQATPPHSLWNGIDYATASAQDRNRWIEFYKMKFTTSWFTSLTNKRSADGKDVRNLVLNTRAGFGFLGMYNQRVGLSPFERFYLGGSGLTGYAIDGREIIALRGYDDQSLSPSQGAAFITKYTMELRYPISLNPQATVYALGFAEAGNSWNSFKNFNPLSVKRSAGIGLRIFLPMFGLLGFDYGWRFDDVPGFPTMQKSQFHFTIGAAIGEL